MPPKVKGYSPNLSFTGESSFMLQTQAISGAEAARAIIASRKANSGKKGRHGVQHMSFDGEHSFIVKNKGKFYYLISPDGGTGGIVVEPIGGGGTVMDPVGVPPAPPVLTDPTITTAGGTGTSGAGSGIVVPEPGNGLPANTGGATDTGGVQTPPIMNPILLSLPMWSTMDCPSILTELDNIRNMMATSKLSPDEITLWTNAMEQGKQEYTKRCGASNSSQTDSPASTASTVAAAVTAASIGSGIRAAGGGGGGGAQDATGAGAVKATDYTWWVLGGVALFAFLLMRKKKA